MQVRNRFLSVTTTNVGMHRAALNRTRTNECDLHHKVVKPAWLQARKRGHLCARFNLKHTHRVGATQHGIHLIFLRNGCQVYMYATKLCDEIDCVVQCREHAKTQQIKLHQPSRGAVVFVPLQHTAPFHTTPLHWTHFSDWTIAHHHATRMNAQVSWCVLHLLGKLQHLCGNAVVTTVYRYANGTPRIHLFAPCILLPRRKTKSASHVAHCRLRSIRNDVGNLCSMMTTVSLIHVLNDFFAPAAFNININIGWAIALWRQKPFKQQTKRHRIGLRDIERITHRAVCRTATTLTVNIGSRAELNDVPHHQEIPSEPERLNHL